MKNQNTIFLVNNFSFFTEKRFIFKQSQTPSESFLKLPEQVTKEKLKELKKQIESFDVDIDKVKDLDLQLEQADEEEKTLLDQVKSRFEKYSAEIAEIEKGALNPDQELLLQDVKLILLQLQKDIASYMAGNQDIEFKSEYAETEEYFEKEGFELMENISFGRYHYDRRSEKTIFLNDDTKAFNLKQKKELIKLFSSFSDKNQIELIIVDLYSFPLKDGNINFEQLKRFITNLQNPNFRKSYFLARSRIESKFTHILREIATDNPEGFIKLFSKRNIEAIIHFLNSFEDCCYGGDHHYFLSIALHNISPFVDVINLSNQGKKHTEILQYLFKNRKYRSNPYLIDFIKKTNKYLTLLDSPEERLMMEKETINIKSKIDQFLDSCGDNKLYNELKISTWRTFSRYHKDKDSLRANTSNIEKRTLVIGGLPIVFDRNMNISYEDYLKEYYEGFSPAETDWFYQELEKAGIKNIVDLQNKEKLIVLKDILTKYKEKKAKHRSQAEVREQIEGLSNKYDLDYSIRLESGNNINIFDVYHLDSDHDLMELNMGDEYWIFFNIVFDPASNKIIRCSPKLKDILKKKNITTVNDFIEKFDEFKNDFNDIFTSTWDQDKKRIDIEILQRTKLHKIGVRVKEKLNSAFEAINEAFQQTQNYEMLLKFNFYVTEEGLKFELKRGNEFSGIKFKIDENENIIMYPRQYSVFGKNFVATFKDKIKKADDIISYKDEIDEWNKADYVREKEKKERQEFYHESAKQEQNKIERIIKNNDLEKELYVNNEGEFVDNEYIKNIKVSFKTAKWLEVEGVALYDRATNSFSYIFQSENYKTREQFVNAIIISYREERFKENIVVFYEEEFYQLKAIFSDEDINSFILPTLKLGFDEYSKFLANLYFGEQNEKYKGNFKLLKYILKPKNFNRLSKEQKKKILNDNDSNINEYSTTENEERKKILINTIDSSFQALIDIIISRNIAADTKEEVKNYLINKLNCCKKNINEIIFSNIIKLIRYKRLDKGIKKSFLEAINEKFNSFSEEDKGEIFTLLSDINIFILAPKDLQEKTIKKADSTLRASSEVTIIKNASDYFQNLLSAKGISPEIKRKILDTFYEYFNKPDNFKFTKTCDSMFCTAMSNAFSFGLLKNLAKPEFDNLVIEEQGAEKKYRDAVLEKLLSFAESVLQTDDTNRSEYARAKFIAFSCSNLFSKIELPEAIRAVIEKLNVVPTSPDKKRFEDGKWISKIYFQESMKERIWKKMYINAKFGFHIEDYSLGIETQVSDIIKADLVAQLKIAQNESRDYGTFAGKLATSLLKKDFVVRDQMKITMAKCLEVANQIKKGGKLNMTDPLIAKTADTLRRVGVFNDEIWVRSWRDNGEKREQKVIIPRSPYSSSEFNGSVFEGLSKSYKGEEIDDVVYNGHAGSGTSLDSSFKKVTDYYGSPVVQLANCWSKTEMGRIQKYFPNAHPIVTKVQAMSGDGCLIFASRLETVKQDWDKTKYSDIREAITNNSFNIPNAAGTGKYHEDNVGNRIFIDEVEMRQLIDSDGDGVPDVQDNTYDFVPEKVWRNEYEYRFTPPRAMELPSAPREKVDRTIGFVARLFEDDPLLANFSYRDDKLGNGFPKFIIDTSEYVDYQGRQAGGYFISRIDSQELLKFREDTSRLERPDGTSFNEPVVRISLNLGYANLHEDVLRSRVYTEVVRYVHDNHFELSRTILKDEVLPEKEKVDQKIIDELKLKPLLSSEAIFKALEAEGDEQIKLVNRCRTLITSLKYWKRGWENNKNAISDQGETAELIIEKEGLQTIFRETMHNGENYFGVEITNDEMFKVLKISENPYLWLLRLVVKKKNASKAVK